MTATRYTLDDFIHDMTDLVARESSRARSRPCLDAVSYARARSRLKT